ncbi:MAG: vanomycin resistance protein VanB [Chloroflexaceae bacterium]|nr:vanomycin resistance protein VanB [Chloroflexaceae bacterium]
MPVGDYFQKYGPIQRRKSQAAHDPDELESPKPAEYSRERFADDPPTGEYAGEYLSARERIQARRTVRRRRTRRGVPLRIFGVLLLVVALLALAVPAAVYASYHDRAFPGISIQGVDISNLERAAISATVQARYGRFVREPVTITFRNQTWAPSLDELGVRFDIEQMTEAAMQVGREGDVLARTERLWQVWNEGLDIAPQLIIDEQQLQQYLVQMSSEVNIPPRDAALSIAYAKIIATPAEPGLQVLIAETRNDIILGLNTLNPQQVALRTRTLEPGINDTVLATAEQQARDLLAAPLVLTHNDQQWVWNAEQIADLLAVEARDGGLHFNVNTDLLEREVERLAVTIDSGSAEPRLRFAAGNLYVVQEGQIGWRVQHPETMEVISQTLTASTATTRTVQIPAERISPQVTPDTLATLGINELLGEGRSSFAGSAAYRITNIKAGAARMDGVLIAPGEEFSFNTQLGEVNERNGFVEGYAVVGNRTKLEWGGGVCQDSTTVFRAAFWAGLPITEWHPHPFYISWYDRFGLGPYGDGAGLDAAIYTGLNDLRFVNDTGKWILMQVDVNEASQVMSVQLYGTDPNNRTVQIEGPYITNEIAAPSTPVYIDDASKPVGYFYQSDMARNGRDITVHRMIAENGVEVRRDTFLTRFKAWPNVFVRGTSTGG